MQMIIEMLKELQSYIKAGEQKNNADITATLRLLDIRTMLLLKEFGYTEMKPLVNLRGLHGDQLSEDVKCVIAYANKKPACALALAVNGMIHNVEKRFEYDFGCTPECTMIDRLLKFKWNILSWGEHGASMLSPKELIEQRCKVKNRMKQNGFVFDDRKLPFTANHQAFEKYLNSIGGDMLRFTVEDGYIEEIAGYIQLFEYPFWKEVSEAIAEPTNILSESEVYHINKEVNNYISSLTAYAIMDDKNMMLNLYLSYMANIERSLGYLHYDAAKALEKKYAESREKNVAAQKLRENACAEIFCEHQSQLLSFIAEVQNALDTMLKPLGLACRNLEITQYGECVFEAIPRFHWRLDGDNTQKALMDAEWDEMNQHYQFKDTRGNIGVLTNAVKQGLPHAEVLEWTCYGDCYVRSYKLRTSAASDLIELLDKFSLDDAEE